MTNKRYAESISILNDLYITSNDNESIYCDIMFNLASCHYEMKEYDRSKILYMKALEKKRATGDDSELNLSSIASILNSLGHIYYDQVQIDAAKIAYEEAYSIVKRLLGSDHIFVINIMTSIANCNIINCDYDTAHKIFYRISNKLKDKNMNDQIDSELVNSIIKLQKVYLYQYSNDKNRYKLLIEQVLLMLENLLDKYDPIVIQAKKDYKTVSNEGSFIKRLSLPSKTNTNTNVEENQNDKIKRKSMFESIPFLTP
jgi:tetratricopeptide (TPR) repeat protein